MTKKQYENLKIGDLVSCYNGPNKNVIMRVTKNILEDSILIA